MPNHCKVNFIDDLTVHRRAVIPAKFKAILTMRGGNPFLYRC